MTEESAKATQSRIDATWQAIRLQGAAGVQGEREMLVGTEGLVKFQGVYYFLLMKVHDIRNFYRNSTIKKMR